jgi:hypothetical protein
MLSLAAPLPAVLWQAGFDKLSMTAFFPFFLFFFRSFFLFSRKITTFALHFY